MDPRYPMPDDAEANSGAAWSGELARTRIPLPTQGSRGPGAAPTVDQAQDFLAYAAGAANVIMQLSWPEVGHGVVESPVDSGNLLLHPIKRARTTFTYLAVAVGGSPTERHAYGRAVSRVHAQVRSTESSPVSYNALHAQLQWWVAACLYVGFEDTHQLLHGRLSETQRATFLASAAPLGTTLQVRDSDWPASPEIFDAAWVAGCRRVAIDAVVRDYLNALVDLHHQPAWVRALGANRLRFLTAGFLPPLFREHMQWTWRSEDQHRFDRTLRRWARVNGYLPRPVRFLPATVLRADLRRRLRRDIPLV